MREVSKNEHGKYWITALEAKYQDKGKPFGRDEFDDFLGDFAVSMSSGDLPNVRLQRQGSERSPRRCFLG
jgi:hypothetical protein